MDFAENWNTDQLNQVQSAYFDRDSVTIHPCVVHIPGQESAASYAFIAADKSSNANMVYAVVKPLISALKVKLPGLRRVHFITDSPTSQYRNKTMFHLVATAKKLLGVEVSRTYFEAGHGKGPSNGVGGAVKRVADQEVNKGSLIQNAWDLYKVMRLLPSKIQYMYITTNQSRRRQPKSSNWPWRRWRAQWRHMRWWGWGTGIMQPERLLVLRSAVIREGSLFWGVLSGRGG